MKDDPMQPGGPGLEVRDDELFAVGSLVEQTADPDLRAPPHAERPAVAQIDHHCRLVRDFGRDVGEDDVASAYDALTGAASGVAGIAVSRRS